MYIILNVAVEIKYQRNHTVQCGCQVMDSDLHFTTLLAHSNVKTWVSIEVTVPSGTLSVCLG